MFARRFGHLMPAATSVLLFAEEEARRLRHDYIGAQHLLLGLIRDAASRPSQSLRQRGADLATLRVYFRRWDGEDPPASTLALSPPLIQALQIAVNEATRLGHDEILPDHLLLAVLHSRDSVVELSSQDLGIASLTARRPTVEDLHVQQDVELDLPSPGNSSQSA
jgi:ATP-dependent Clp protease ATP-binding subunit ClpC